MLIHLWGFSQCEWSNVSIDVSPSGDQITITGSVPEACAGKEIYADFSTGYCPCKFSKNVSISGQSFIIQVSKAEVLENCPSTARSRVDECFDCSKIKVNLKCVGSDCSQEAEASFRCQKECPSIFLDLGEPRCVTEGGTSRIELDYDIKVEGSFDDFDWRDERLFNGTGEDFYFELGPDNTSSGTLVYECEEQGEEVIVFAELGVCDRDARDDEGNRIRVQSDRITKELPYCSCPLEAPGISAVWDDDSCLLILNAVLAENCIDPNANVVWYVGGIPIVGYKLNETVRYLVPDQGEKRVLLVVPGYEDCSFSVDTQCPSSNITTESDCDWWEFWCDWGPVPNWLCILLLFLTVPLVSALVFGIAAGDPSTNLAPARELKSILERETGVTLSSLDWLDSAEAALAYNILNQGLLLVWFLFYQFCPCEALIALGIGMVMGIVFVIILAIIPWTRPVVPAWVAAVIFGFVGAVIAALMYAEIC